MEELPAKEIQASGYAPRDDREAAIVQTLPPGNYTAIVRGIAATVGTALLEVHDLDQSSASLITNISTRGAVGTDANVMIGGFIVGNGLGSNGDGSSEVLVRALGPELTSFGIADALLDPKMELFDGNGNLLASNDNWKDSQQAAIQATGLAPGDDRDPAILAILIQGNWTAIVRGKNNTTGVALLKSTGFTDVAAAVAGGREPLQLGQQVFQIQSSREHLNLSVCITRP